MNPFGDDANDHSPEIRGRFIEILKGLNPTASTSSLLYFLHMVQMGMPVYCLAPQVHPNTSEELEIGILVPVHSPNETSFEMWMKPYNSADFEKTVKYRIPQH